MQTRYINGKDNGEYFLFHENGVLPVKEVLKMENLLEFGNTTILVGN